MLFEQLRHALVAEAMRKDNTLSRSRHDVTQFEALCTVLRGEGCSFTERVEVEEHAVQFYITPDHPSDYRAILESTRLMEARRTRSPHARLFGYDLVDLTPEAPAFWLFTFSGADVYKKEETR